jgi:hypothetical protein
MPVVESADPIRRDAIERSRGCPYCGGGGLARVYDPRYRGRAVASVVVRVEPDGTAVRRNFAMAVMAHCLCPNGRDMRRRLTTEQARGIPDLEDVLAGRTRWLAADPTEDRHAP